MGSMAWEQPVVANLGKIVEERLMVADLGRLAFELPRVTIWGIVDRKRPWWLILSKA